MLLDRLKRAIERHHLLDHRDRVIVGVSGGVDSMVLLHLLNACCETRALTLIVAHVNHGLRPDESEREAALVQQEADRLGLPYEYGQFDVKDFQKKRGLSPQDAARRVRFHFFNSLLKKHDAQKIALGHNADDQVETMLLRWIRGSGVKGLKGMLPIREGRVIRPLLEIWRSEIDAFAAKQGIPYRVDSSNLRPHYLRNRIRLELIPLIERDYQPNFKEVMKKASVVLREEDDCLEEEAEKTCQKTLCLEGEVLFFSYFTFRSLHKAIQWRVLQRMLRSMGSEETWEEGDESEVGRVHRLLAHPPSSFLVELTGGLYLEKRYDRVSLGRGKVKPVPPFEVELRMPGPTLIEEIGKEVMVEEITWKGDLEGLRESPDTAILASEHVQWPLKLRNFRRGDRFQPLGVRGTQKLKQFFIDHKIPKYERPKIPILISGEAIAWVVGYRIDERFQITQNIQRAIRIKVA